MCIDDVHPLHELTCAHIYTHTHTYKTHTPTQHPHSENWGWVAAIASYSQAVTSQWAELLYDGVLVAGDRMPVPRLNYNIPPDIMSPVNYRTWAGSQSVAVYVRRATDGSGTLVVVGTVQPQSSIVGNAPLVVNATLALPGPDGEAGAGPRITLSFRRQGSTYLIKMKATTTPTTTADYSAKKNAAVVVGVESVTQLDAWHEATHPSYWSRDIRIEAEVHDGRRFLSVQRGPSAVRRLSPAVRVRSERPPVGARKEEGGHDWSAFTTWVELVNGGVGEEEATMGGVRSGNGGGSVLHVVNGIGTEEAVAKKTTEKKKKKENTTTDNNRNESTADRVSFTVWPRCPVTKVCKYRAMVRVRKGCVTVTVDDGADVGPTHLEPVCAPGEEWVWVDAGVVSLERDAPAVLEVAVAVGYDSVHVDVLRLVAF